MPRVKREREEDEPQYASDCDEDAAQADEDAPEAYEDDGAGPSSSRKAVRVAFFAKGAIKQVKVHDFMTYNGTVTIRPGPRLNLLLGPNGTGKSSFVCALCIGLNGSPKTLGRADDLKGFVRRGAHAFWTEITLSSGGEGRDYVVRRHITTRTERDADGALKARYDSKWAINGRDVSAKDVDKLVKSLNIQFDNLCQFLPQDKVVEFARLDKYGLLESTQKAVGDSSLYDQHQRLIQLRKDEKQVAADHTTTSNRLVKLQADHERQRRDYERFQHRRKLLQEARAFRCQAKWLEVYAKVKAAEGAKKRLEEERAALRALEEQQQEDTRPITQREELISRIKIQQAAAERRGRDVQASMRRLMADLGKHDVDVVGLTDEIEALEEQSKARAAGIAAARQKLATVEAELAQAPDKPPQAMLDRLAELRNSAQACRREMLELDTQQNNLGLQDQGLQAEIGRVRSDLSLLNSRKHQLLQNLGNAKGFHNLPQLHHWVEQHRTDGTFCGPVLGPVILEMSINTIPGLPHPTVLQYVEATCFDSMGTYVVSCVEDEKLLNQQARSMNVGTRVKVAAAIGDPGSPFDREIAAARVSQHARYGIVHSLDELIDAPPTIMRWLAKAHKIDMIMIGNNHAPSAMQAIMRETNINTVLVGSSRFNVLRSRYAPAQSVAETEFYPSRLLASCGSSEDDIQRAALLEKEQALSQEREQLQASMAALRDKQEQLNRQMTEEMTEAQRVNGQVETVKRRRSTFLGNLETAKRQLANREAQPDPELKRPALRKAIEDRLVTHAQLLRKIVAEGHAAWAGVKEAQVLEFKLRETGAQLNALKDCRKQREEALMAARSAVVDADKAFKSLRGEYVRAKEAAEAACPPDDNDKLEIKRHDEAGTPPATLVSMAEAKEEEAEQVACNNQNVVTEFQMRQTEIDQLTQVMQQHDAELQRLQREISDLKDLWLPEVQKMVETINESFSKNFKEIGYAGMVRLQEHEDFDKFAVEILVQFRANEDMQLLTANRQSGGERSVSTLLYLIALQGVTDTPFRVVDEINQGMDPINERKVFQHLVRASCEEHTPQCFMLTPKLLDNLTYTRDIQVLTIFAGANIRQLVETFKLGMGHNNGRGFFGDRAEPVLPAP